MMIQQGWILWAVLAAMVLFAIVLFNIMVGRRNIMSQAFSTIST